MALKRLPGKVKMYRSIPSIVPHPLSKQTQTTNRRISMALHKVLNMIYKNLFKGGC